MKPKPKINPVASVVFAVLPMADIQKLSIKVKSPLSQALRSASTVLDEELL